MKSKYLTSFLYYILQNTYANIILLLPIVNITQLGVYQQVLVYRLGIVCIGLVTHTILLHKTNSVQVGGSIYNLINTLNRLLCIRKKTFTNINNVKRN